MIPHLVKCSRCVRHLCGQLMISLLLELYPFGTYALLQLVLSVDHYVGSSFLINEIKKDFKPHRLTRGGKFYFMGQRHFL